MEEVKGQIIQTVISWIGWLTPFTFVFFLLVVIKETIHNGKNDITYGLILAISLLILAFECIYINY